MADYMMVLQANSATKEVPNEVFIYLNHPFEPWKSNTWIIDTPNTWIGIGSGEYKYMSGALHFADGKYSVGNSRFRFLGIRYPDDCTPYIEPNGNSYVRDGECLYSVPNRPEILGAAKWYGKNIRKDGP